jgi:hypothetical protein
MVANEGERYAAAFLAKDWDGVRAVLDPAVDFRGMTPGQVWEAKTSDDLIDQVLRRWVEHDDIYDVLEVSSGQVVDRQRVAYRFRFRNPSGDYVCEQTAYYDTDAGRITKLRLLCSGPRRTGGRS